MSPGRYTTKRRGHRRFKDVRFETSTIILTRLCGPGKCSAPAAPFSQRFFLSISRIPLTCALCGQERALAQSVTAPAPRHKTARRSLSSGALKRACPHCAVCGDGRPAKVAGGTRLPQFCLGQDPKIKAYRSPAASPAPFSKTWPTRARHHAHSRVEQLVPRFEATYNPGALEQDGRQPPDRDSAHKRYNAPAARPIAVASGTSTRRPVRTS